MKLMHGNLSSSVKSVYLSYSNSWNSSYRLGSENKAKSKEKESIEINLTAEIKPLKLIDEITINFTK